MTARRYSWLGNQCSGRSMTRHVGDNIVQRIWRSRQWGRSLINVDFLVLGYILTYCYSSCPLVSTTLAAYDMTSM